MAGATSLMLEKNSRPTQQAVRKALFPPALHGRKEGVLMHEPVTTLDARYSDPNAAATPWEQTRQGLEAADVFWLSTVRADGRPHVTPVVGVWHDEALHFSTADTEQKAINLMGNPHIVLTTGCNLWQEGLDVVVEGDAIRITEQDRLERLARVWATRWDGRWQYLVRDGCFYHHDEHEMLPDAILVFSVTPTRVFAFAKGDPFSHTRHRF
jgi:nitroimidazol reductase NimA-like FMN-containing flavoprotein (pyridoxamine 5'-phosphate oxidase superfamily)